MLDSAVARPRPRFLTTLNDGLNSGDTTFGELWSVSQGGAVVFGRSFLTGNTGDYYSFKTTIAGFGAGRTQGPVVKLPELAGVAGPGRSVPYGCSADGTFAVSAE